MKLFPPKISYKFIVIVLIFGFLINGCSLPFSTPQNPTATVIPISSILLPQTQNIIPTLTPFQPIPPTPTSGPTNTPFPTSTSTIQPTATSSYGTRLGLTRPEGQVNILLLGSDKRNSSGYRTDVILVLSLNPNNGTVTLLSFPRDLYVTIPGVGSDRINITQAYGGFSLSAAMLKNNFDVPVDYYFLVSFSGFKSIIDSIGGIYVESSKSLKDKCDLPQAVDGFCTISPGTIYMDGATALWYVRSRKSTSDFDRTRRAQEVIIGLFNQVMSLDAVNRAEELYNRFDESVETNMPLSAIINILPLANQTISDPSIIKRYAIGAENTTGYIVPGTGASVLLPDFQSIADIIRLAIYQ